MRRRQPRNGRRLRAVLTNDPGIGVIRHLDAGYAEGAGLPLGG
jgi:urocanate hydratase